VFFRREDLVLGQDVKLKLADGSRRAMTQADLDANPWGRRRFCPTEASRHRLSKFVDGRRGPFNYHPAQDDPKRPILTAAPGDAAELRIFAAWLNHFDTKQHTRGCLSRAPGAGQPGPLPHRFARPWDREPAALRRATGRE